MSDTYREYIEQILPGFLRNERGIAYTGVLGLVFDMLAEGASQATQLHFVSKAPTDALGFVGLQKDTERFPGETNAAYKARIAVGVESHLQGGTKQVIEDNLALCWKAGEVYEDADWNTQPKPFWTNMWVFFPKELTHGVAGAELYGAASTYSSYPLAPLVYGASQGATPQLSMMLRSLLRKYKAARTVVRKIIFEISGESYGTGHTYNEGFNYGGEQATIEM